MASKNLLPVAALCSALATGMPVAALATPAVDVPLPAVNCLATNQMSTIARQRFSLAQASISASGCLRRCTNSSIVVDTEHSSTTDGPLTGCVICTWRAAATDADGDSCDVELCLDITCPMTRRTGQQSPSTARFSKTEEVYAWAASPRAPMARSPLSHSPHR